MALGKLPMVNNFQSHREVSTKNEFEFVFSMEFKSAQEYDAYNNNPDHINFVETRWKPEVEDFMEIDYLKHQIN